MITRAISHEMAHEALCHHVIQMAHEALCHHVIQNITKFQSCRCDNKFFIGQKPVQKHFRQKQ